MRLRFQILVLALVVFTTEGFAQKVNPPGTTWLRNNLYIDLAPIANVHYKEYEYSMSKFIKYNLDTFQKLVTSLPYFGVNTKAFLEGLKIQPYLDSANFKINPEESISWDKPANFEIDLNLPSYNNYPIVNASYDLAKYFCAWRTAMVQLHYSASTSEKERHKFYKKVAYRLATKEEWEFAQAKFSNTKKFPQLKSASPAKENYFTITNLSEFVDDKNVFVNTRVDFKPPANLTTFRCVCEVEN